MGLFKLMIDLGGWGLFPPKQQGLPLKIGRSKTKEHNNLDVAPSQDASDKQDYYIFSRESRTKPSSTTVTGRGPHPNNNLLSINFQRAMLCLF